MYLEIMYFIAFIYMYIYTYIYMNMYEVSTWFPPPSARPRNPSILC